MGQPLLIGVAGGSGSGKTTVAKELYKQFEHESVLMIEQDSYYKDQSHLTHGRAGQDQLRSSVCI
jgi:uridine kinase